MGVVDAVRLFSILSGEPAIYRLIFFPCILYGLVSCSEPGPQRPYFVDGTQRAGIGFRQTSGARGDYFLFETMGSGAAFVDVDGDGWLDIYLVDGFDLAPWRGRFRPSNEVSNDENGHWVIEGFQAPLRSDGRVDSTVFDIRQEPDDEMVRNQLLKSRHGVFSDVSAESGADDPGYGMGVAVGDYNNDGSPDLYVTNYGVNALYENGGAGLFSNKAKAAGVDDPHWGSSAAFFDADNDGDLDLYVANYLDASPSNNRLCGGAVSKANSPAGRALLVPRDYRTYCSPRRYNGAPDVLYRNEGDGTFSDISRASGIFTVYGKGLGVAAADLDLDGDVDLFVANDGMRNFLYRNDGEHFVENALEAGLAYNGQGQPEAGMGIAVADYDHDEDVDLLVTNFSRESNTLYRNEGRGKFSDQSEVMGVHESTFLPLGFGTLFFDADNDADQDVFVANGHVLDRVAQQDADLRYEQSNQLLLYDDSTYVDASTESGPAFALEGVSRGASSGDYDNDGDLDVLVTNVNGPAVLYRNDSAAGRWLSLELVAVRNNRDAIGARLQLRCGQQMQTRQRIGGGSYLSASDARVHFGLGTCSVVDELVIIWPDGQRQVLVDLSANQFLRVIQE